jgi:hypothetical protein
MLFKLSPRYPHHICDQVVDSAHVLRFANICTKVLQSCILAAAYTTGGTVGMLTSFPPYTTGGTIGMVTDLLPAATNHHNLPSYADDITSIASPWTAMCVASANRGISERLLARADPVLRRMTCVAQTERFNLVPKAMGPSVIPQTWV